MWICGGQHSRSQIDVEYFRQFNQSLTTFTLRSPSNRGSIPMVRCKVVAEGGGIGPHTRMSIAVYKAASSNQLEHPPRRSAGCPPQPRSVAPRKLADRGRCL